MPVRRPTVFASGANDPGEIRGFVAAGIAPGLCAPDLREASVMELERLAGYDIPVFLDTGAFGEVSADPAQQRAAELAPTPGQLQVVRPITAPEWRARLGLAERLARALGPQLFAVVPDRVGDQDETLARIRRFAPELRRIASHGAHLLVPLQRGGRSAAAMYREIAAGLGGLALVPAIPMKKDATPIADLVAFVRACRPTRLHLLGLGLKSRKAPTILQALAEAHPALQVSLDANLITAAVGRAGRQPRALTAAQDAVRARGFEAWNRSTQHPAWGLAIDYTDEIATPSGWLGPTGRQRVADLAGLRAPEAAAFVRDPDAFLQAPVHRDDADDVDALRWYDVPTLAAALDDAWLTVLHRLHTAPRKAEAIARTFATHPAAGQFPAPPHAAEVLPSTDPLLAVARTTDAVANAA